MFLDSPQTNNIISSDYIIPKLDENFDFRALYPDPVQLDLEKSWKSLDNFKQSHKGRLDSAKNFDLKFGKWARHLCKTMNKQCEQFCDVLL